ncbi:hypothetical protein DPMN_061869 [Dreissena polymorpha]|uniref:Uncharacterized protein n=1 Tax=Dreissena polymorpha TaxID=45954 RepID=A0A9D4C8J0_DREPO|nr:hypothetical protein DPMN_061869 [Dreissena polymorpha]
MLQNTSFNKPSYVQSAHTSTCTSKRNMHFLSEREREINSLFAGTLRTACFCASVKSRACPD